MRTVPPVDEELARRRAAAFAHIVQWGDPVLRTRAREVEHFDDALRRQAAEMGRLMDDAHGAGLAAPQVGLTNRVFVFRADAEGPVRTLVNPVLEDRSDDTVLGLEGCLSLGRSGVWVAVERPRAVVLRAAEPDGSEVRVEAEGHEARILQHELDHLDGVLMLERTDAEHRRAAVRALRLGEPWSPPWPEEDEEGEAAVEDDPPPAA